MLFLCQTIPVLTADLPFKHTNNYGKIRIQYKQLQDAKERGGLELPDLKLYFEACCLVWMKVWMILKNRWLLELEGHDLRFGWHSYLRLT